MPPSIWGALFGTKNLGREGRRQRIKENQEQGRMGERRFRFWALTLGWDVERTGRGSDYRMSKRDPWTGRKRNRLIDVKTGNSPLSPPPTEEDAGHPSGQVRRGERRQSA